MRAQSHTGGLKSSYNYVIFAFDDIFYPWDSNTALPMENMCGQQGVRC